MRALLLAPALAAPLLAAGCSGTTDCDPAVEECDFGDTAATYEGDVKLLQFDHGCCGPGEDRCPGLGAWWVDVVTEGRPASVAFTVLEAGLPTNLRWSESHAVPAGFSDPDGYWTDHYLQVEVTRTTDCSSLKDCAERFSSGQNTLFPCSADIEADNIQVMVELFDADGAELACAQDGATSVDAPGCGS
jgi:hypothetical protein